ncbi:MAG: hypothetical protein RR022_08220 [Angelakisella sp.]
MTKTIITLLITIYSLARLVSIALLFYFEKMRLPGGVLFCTVLCCLFCLFVCASCYLGRSTGNTLRLALLACSVAAMTNMVLVLTKQPGSLTTAELLVTGTLFDLLAFAGSCTLKIRDTRGLTGKSPFSRIVAQNKQQ